MSACRARPQQSDEDDGSPASEEESEKLALRRAKNREAARRVRERRLNTIKSLGEEVEELKAEKARLVKLFEERGGGGGGDGAGTSAQPSASAAVRRRRAATADAETQTDAPPTPPTPPPPPPSQQPDVLPPALMPQPQPPRQQQGAGVGASQLPMDMAQLQALLASHQALLLQMQKLHQQQQQHGGSSAAPAGADGASPLQPQQPRQQPQQHYQHHGQQRIVPFVSNELLKPMAPAPPLHGASRPSHVAVTHRVPGGWPPDDGDGGGDDKDGGGAGGSGAGGAGAGASSRSLAGLLAAFGGSGSGAFDDPMAISADLNAMSLGGGELLTDELLRQVPTPEEATASKSTAWL